MNVKKLFCFGAVLLLLLGIVLFAPSCNKQDIDGLENGFTVEDGCVLTVDFPVSVKSFTFTEKMDVLKDAESFRVTVDAEGNEAVPNNTVELREGQNVFYLFVNIGGAEKQYTVEIYCGNGYFITFDTQGGTAIDPLFVGSGKKVPKPDVTPVLLGYNFDGWDFDFDNTIDGDTVICAKFTVKPEMKDFIFNSSADRCEITGVKSAKSHTSIVVPDYVTDIAAQAFEDCHFLEEITLPFVGGSKFATEASESTLFGYIFGRKELKEPIYNSSSWYVEYNLTAELYIQSFSPDGEASYAVPYSLKKVTVTGGEIFYGAFSNIRCLREIDIFDTVRVSGERTFWDCIDLEQVSLPDTMVSIPAHAFEYCNTLRTVNIPQRIMGIGDFAFANTGITAMTVPEGVVKIGKGAFFQCEELVTLKVNSMDLTVDNEAFMGCISLETVSFMDGGRAELGAAAFSGCSSLSSVKLPDTLISISFGCFEECTSLKSIMLNYGLREIGDGAFRGCSALESIVIPATVPKLSKFVFEGCTALRSVIDASGVTEIGEGAFRNCVSLSEFVLPSVLKSLGDSAFEECWSLSQVDLPAKLEVLGKRAFYNCNHLESITIPSGVKLLEDEIFAYCYVLKTVTLHSDIVKLGEGAFKHCVSLGGIDVPSKTTSIGKEAFYNCISAKYITFPDTVTSIGENAFYGCRSAASDIVIPKKITVVKEGVFSGCSSLTSITLHSSVKSIGKGAFRGCTSVTELILPDSLTLIGVGAFAGMGITTIELPSAITEINGELFAGCKSLVSVTRKTPVTRVGYSAFEGCSSLVTIEFTDSLTKLEESAFKDSGLEVFVIPDSVVSFGKTVFENCRSLRELTVGGGVKVFREMTLRGCVSLERLIFREGVESLERFWWYEFDSLEYVYLPDSLTFSGRDIICEGGVGISADSTRYALSDNCLIDIASGTVIHAWGDHVIPDDGSVTAIGDYAFAGYAKEEYTVPEFITAIGANAFGESLKRLYIESPRITLDPHVFLSSTSLEEVHFADFGYWCESYVGQYDCHPLANVRVFEKGRPLTDVVIAEGVTEIKKYAFKNCDWIESITFANSVLVIRESAFYDCDGLTKLILGKKIGKIESRAFYDCDGLTSVKLNGTRLYQVDSEAFYGCSCLKEIVLNGSQLAIVAGSSTFGHLAYYAAYVCESESAISVVTEGDFRFICENGEYLLVAYTGRESRVVLPDSVGGERYKLGAFTSLSVIEELVIGEGVYSIADGAFRDLKNLRAVTVASRDCHIGEEAFAKCTELTSVRISGTGITMGTAVFSGAESLTDVYISGVSQLPDKLFVKCKSIEIMTFGEGLHTVSENTFKDCDIKVVDILDLVGWCGVDFYKTSPTYLADTVCINGVPVSNLVIPEGVTRIGKFAFCYLSQITSVSFPETLTEIGGNAFLKCGGILTLNTVRVREIGESAFYGASSLRSVTLGTELETIGNFAFVYCDNLREIVLNGCALPLSPGGEEYGGIAANAVRIDGESSELMRVGDYLFVTYYGNHYLAGYLGLDRVLTLPESFEGQPYYIEKNAFYKNRLITSVTIPDGVSGIGDGAFSGCTALREIVIGDGVRRIEDSAFRGCSSLETVKMGRGITYIGAYAFKECGSSAHVYIPDAVAWCQAEFYDRYSSPTSCSEAVYLAGEKVTVLSIPAEAGTVPAFAFTGSGGITKVIVGGVAVIGESAFSGIQSLVQVVLENGVREICYGAFLTEYGYLSVTLAPSVEIIHSKAFGDNVYELAMNGCGIELVDEVSLVQWFDYVSYRHDGVGTMELRGNFLFYRKDGKVYLGKFFSDVTTKSITLPESFDGEKYCIADGAFEDLFYLEKVIIPDGAVSVIESGAFCGFLQYFSSLVIGRGVETIEDGVISTEFVAVTVYIDADCNYLYAFRGAIPNILLVE